jgi:hypothetical protein
LAISALLLATLVHCYLGWYSRYYADDYCFASKLSTGEFWSAQIEWYRGWTGRFASTLVISLVDLAGPGAARWVPGCALILWLLLLAWAIYPMRLSREPGRWPDSWLLATLTLFGTTTDLPNAYQSLYWQNNLLTHTAPLLGFTVLGGLLVRDVHAREGSPHTLWRGAIAMTAFLTAGFSEMATAIQLGALVLALVLLSGHRKRLARPRLGGVLIALIATLVGAGLLIFAPGNAIRQSGIAPPTALPELLPRAYAETLLFLHRALEEAPLALAIPLVLPFLRTVCLSRPPSSPASGSEGGAVARWLVLVPVSGATLLLTSFVPAAYALSAATPPDRTLILPRFLLATLTTCWGWLAGRAFLDVFRDLRRPVSLGFRTFAWALTLLLLWMGPVTEALDLRSQRRPVRSLAHAWEERDSAIRRAAAAGHDALYVSPLEVGHGIPDIGPDPQGWVNRCMANYYGVEAIVAEPEPSHEVTVTPVRTRGTADRETPEEMVLTGNPDRGAPNRPARIRFGTGEADGPRPRMHPSGEGTVASELVDGLRTGTGDPTWECLLWDNPQPYRAFSAHVTIDLGAVSAVGRVEAWTVSPYRDYWIDRVDLLLSVDGEGFERVGFSMNSRSERRTGAYALEIRAGGVPARFVRLILNQFDGSGTVMPLCEVFVYGHPHQ